ncbi:MAG TPA: SRPBCC family protein [Vicinamibacterales bacterium]|nr:SRPBCC family protein [Vicinamibacterales bacterium]
MKWALMTGAGLVAVIAIVAIIGAALPRSHTASRSTRINGSPQAIWAAITEVEAFPDWRSDVKKVERLQDRDGRPVWVEEGPTGRMTLAVERSEPPRLLVLRIADPDLPYGGTWTYELSPQPGGGVMLSVTEDGEIYNPIFRFMARFVFGYEATMDTYLASLAARFEGTREMTRKKG